MARKREIWVTVGDYMDGFYSDPRFLYGCDWQACDMDTDTEIYLFDPSFSLSKRDEYIKLIDASLVEAGKFNIEKSLRMQAELGELLSKDEELLKIFDDIEGVIDDEDTII